MDRNSEHLSYTVLYDGDCSFCARWVTRLKRWDREGVLSFLPSSDPATEALFPGISPGDLEESIHLVGPRGKIWKGAGAVEEIVRLLPRWRFLGPIFHLPLARTVAGWLYRFVARNRYRLTCTDHCA